MLQPGEDTMYGDQRRTVVDVTADGWAVLRRTDDDPAREVDAEGGDVDLVAVQAAAFSPVS